MISLVIFSIIGVISTATTFLLYRNRLVKEIPLFVTLQMVFLNLMWILSVVDKGYVVANQVDLNREDRFTNYVASTAAACLLIHEWLFTD